jgi:hypothetical protein
MMSPHRRNVGPMLSSVRCGAKTRSGGPCRSPAAGGKQRCRMHGGAPGSGAPRGNQNARTHGLYTRAAVAERRQVSDLLRQSRELMAKINEGGIGSAAARHDIGAAGAPALNGSTATAHIAKSGHAAIVAGAADQQGRQVMEESSQQHCQPRTSHGVTFSAAKRESRTELTFHLSDAEQTARFLQEFGSQDPDFVFGLVRQVANATRNSQLPDEEGIKFMMSVITGLKPRDQTEAMIGAQMATVHSAIMTAANRLGHAAKTAEMDSAERAVNKLARTFAALVDTLSRHRDGAERNVTVQQLSIPEGGQAIVGSLPPPHDQIESTEAAETAGAGSRPTAEIIKEPARVKVPMRRAAPVARRTISGAATKRR